MYFLSWESNERIIFVLKKFVLLVFVWLPTFANCLYQMNLMIIELFVCLYMTAPHLSNLGIIKGYNIQTVRYSAWNYILVPSKSSLRALEWKLSNPANIGRTNKIRNWTLVGICIKNWQPTFYLSQKPLFPMKLQASLVDIIIIEIRIGIENSCVLKKILRYVSSYGAFTRHPFHRFIFFLLLRAG